MSNVIKLGKKNKLNIKIGGNGGFDGFEDESEEEYLQRIEDEKREEIYNAGREDAIREMQEHFSRELKTKFAQFDEFMNSINENLTEYKNSFDKIVIDVSFVVAEKILRKTIPESSIIVNTIKDAIGKIIGANSIVLRLNPLDMKLIEESDEEFLDSKSYSNIKFEIDDRIEQGGCFIESEIGNVDARISSQLNELKNKLMHEITETVQ